MAELQTVTVLLFARYAELLGTATLQMALPEPPTAAAVVAAVRALPGGMSVPESPLVAINAQQAQGGDPVEAGDEVALLPPMAGG